MSVLPLIDNGRVFTKVCSTGDSRSLAPDVFVDSFKRTCRRPCALPTTSPQIFTLYVISRREPHTPATGMSGNMSETCTLHLGSDSRLPNSCQSPAGRRHTDCHCGWLAVMSNVDIAASAYEHVSLCQPQLLVHIYTASIAPYSSSQTTTIWPPVVCLLQLFHPTRPP